METESLLPCSQQPTTCPILSQINPVHSLQSCFFKIRLNNILSYMINFQMVSLFQVFPQKFCIHFCFPQYVPHFVTCPSPSFYHPVKWRYHSYTGWSTNCIFLAVNRNKCAGWGFCWHGNGPSASIRVRGEISWPSVDFVSFSTSTLFHAVSYIQPLH